MPGLHRGGQDFLGIPLVDVHQPYDPLPDASPLSHDAEEEEVDVLGMLAAPSSDDVSIAAMALSRSMTANATRRRQEAQDGYPTRYTLPPPPPPPPADASWFTMFIYKITHSNIYRLITQPSAVIVDLTSRHLQSLQEYSERQRFLSSGASPLGAVSSIFASSTAAKEDSLKKRKSIYHLTEEEDRLARDPDRELSKAVELKPVSMEAVRPARLGDDSDDDDHSMESEYSDNGDDDTAVTDTVDTFDRSGESTRPTQRRRRRRRRVVRGGQGQGKKGVLAYRNPFIDEPRTRGSIHLHSHSRDGSVCPSSEDDMYDDVLEWEDDDIASGYEARTNSVRLMEKGLRNPIPSFALPGDTLSMAKGMNPNYSSHSEPMSMSPPCSPPLSPEDNSYSLYSQKNPGLPRPSSSLHLFDDGPVLARLPKSRTFAQTTINNQHHQQQHQQNSHQEVDSQVPQSQHRVSATFSKNGWQQARPEQGSAWGSVSNTVSIPSEEDTLPAVHDDQNPSLAPISAQPLAENSHSTTNSLQIESSTTHHHSTYGEQYHSNAWLYEDGSAGQDMDHDPQDVRRQNNSSNNSSRKNSIYGEEPMQNHDGSPRMPPRHISTWMRLDTSNDLAASPPASSVTTHQSLEDDEYNEVGNEARQEDKEYVMDTGLDENTSEDATDHLRIRHHPSFSHAELHEEMPIASSDEPA